MKFFNIKKFIPLYVLIPASIINLILLRRNPHLCADSFSYLFPIHNLIDGKGYTLMGNPELIMPPGFGILSYLFYLISGDYELSGMLTSSFMYFLLIVLTYYTVRFLFGKGYDILTTIMVAFSPSFIHFSFHNSSTITFTFFLLLCFFIYTKILLDKSTILRNIILGCSFGFLYLIRPEGLLLALLVLLTLFIFCFIDIKRSKQYSMTSILKRISHPLLVILFLFAFALPYMSYLQKHTGAWKISTKTGVNLIVGEKVVEGFQHKDLLEVQHPEYFSPEFDINIIDYIKSRGKKFFLRVVLNIKWEILFFSKITLNALIPFFCICLIFPFLFGKKLFTNFIMNSRNIRIALSFILFFGSIFGYLIFSIQERFLLPYSIFIIFILSFLMVRFIERINEAFNKNWLNNGIFIITFISIIGVSGIFFYTSSIYKIFNERSRYTGIREAGLWLGNYEQDLKNLKILSPRHGGLVLFYANKEIMPAGNSKNIRPDISIQDIVNLMSKKKFNYLVLDDYWIQRTKNLLPLFNNPDNANEYGLKLIHSNGDGLFKIFIKQN